MKNKIIACFLNHNIYLSYQGWYGIENVLTGEVLTHYKTYKEAFKDLKNLVKQK